MSQQATSPNASTTSLPAFLRGVIPVQILPVLWGVIALIYLAFYIATTPVMLTGFATAEAVQYAEGLARMGWDAQRYATLMVALNQLVPLVSVVVGGVVFWVRRTDRQVWVVTLAIVSFPMQVGRAAPDFALAYPEQWWIPTMLRVLSTSLLLTTLVIFPNGRFYPRWAWVYPLIGAVGLAPFTNDLRTFTRNISFFILMGALYIAVGVAFQVLRYRRSANRTDRQQTKWMIFGLSLATLIIVFSSGLVVLVPPTSLADPLAQVVYRMVYFGLLVILPSTLIPLAFAVAITRSRLWDIDLLINRSLVLGVTSGLLLVGYGGLALVARAVIGEGLGGVPLVGAVLLVGVSFDWTRRRVQQVIDRRLYRWRFDLVQLANAERQRTEATAGAWTGQTVGGYRVEALIGSGGMGKVYRAQRDGRTYALKTVLRDTTSEHVERLRREAEAMAQLSHPNIVRFYETGDAPKPYVVMEWVDGLDLASFLGQRGTLSLAAALPVLRGIADALDHAHSRGVIHRDLKPANILLRATAETGDIVPMLVDFGLAKVSDGLSLTGTGAIGTIAYMAPEQIESAKAVTPKTDLYALGIIAYEMLSGQPPFTGGVGQLLFAHLQQPPTDIRTHAPHLPAEVNDVLQRALAKSPAQRWDTASDFVAQLSRLSIASP
jgi:serine/threonine-protein kinase